MQNKMTIDKGSTGTVTVSLEAWERVIADSINYMHRAAQLEAERKHLAEELTGIYQGIMRCYKTGRYADEADFVVQIQRISNRLTERERANG